jgi:hypothetical protein
MDSTPLRRFIELTQVTPVILLSQETGLPVIPEKGSGSLNPAPRSAVQPAPTA